jgi:HEAT repeat protein
MAENALADQSPKVRVAAARALGRMGAVSSVPKLKTVLNDKEPAVVLAAARSLFLLGDREEAYKIDYEILVGERKCADGFVESQINELKDSKALARMGFETGVGFLPFGGAGYEVLKRISKDGRTPVRAAAARELATDRDPTIGAALAKACSDKNWRVRAAAVDSIANREDPTLLNAITLMLDDKNDIVRYDASAAVLRLSSGKTAELLREGSVLFE